MSILFFCATGRAPPLFGNKQFAALPARQFRTYQCSSLTSIMSDLRRANALFDSKQFAAALPLLQAALRRIEQEPDGSATAEAADVVFKIGYCCDMLNDFPTAAEHFRRAAAITNYNFENRERA